MKQILLNAMRRLRDKCPRLWDYIACAAICNFWDWCAGRRNK